MSNPTISARVKTLQWESDDVLKVILQPVSGTFPAAEAGAHVDVMVPDAPTRQYSLTQGSSEERYVLGIRQNPTGGCSQTIHEALRPGQLIEISAPRNAFSLVSDGPVHLIAGGIGITPILMMASVLATSQRQWTFSYFARSKDDAAFLEEVIAAGGEVFYDDVHGFPNMQPETAKVPQGTHLYCCGPTPMLDAFVEACSDRPAEFVHLERFSAPALKAGDGEFIVEISGGGGEYIIPADKTVLETLIKAGLSPRHNCEAGICGECEVRVLKGEADHRDMLLTDGEKEAGSMLICCSRANTECLIIEMQPC